MILKQGKVRVLVATDVASRGLDIEKLPYVVNFELPNVPEDYVHRIGRTGRAGMVGCAVSLVCKDEYPFLASIEKLLNHTIVKEAIPGYEPSSLADDVEQIPAKRSKQRSNWAKSSTTKPTPSKKPTLVQSRTQKRLRSI